MLTLIVDSKIDTDGGMKANRIQEKNGQPAWMGKKTSKSVWNCVAIFISVDDAAQVVRVLRLEIGTKVK